MPSRVSGWPVAIQIRTPLSRGGTHGGGRKKGFGRRRLSLSRVTFYEEG